MAKPKRQYRCSECGAITLQWAGQCGDCGSWNTLEEAQLESATTKKRPQGLTQAGNKLSLLTEINLEQTIRRSTGIDELDRVLGGGLVDGAVILLGGDPGIGKSTLLLQALAKLSPERRCLYVSGEESLQQISLRAQRLRLRVPDLKLMTETCVERIVDMAKEEAPQVVVIDSIQTMYTEELGSAPGSVAQVRESAAQLVRYAKSNDVAVLIVGHVTKEGALAGPRVLEHMVDTVLYFEGDAGDRYRVIRAVKNRFGAVNELGVFAMLDSGLKPVSNPSAIFLSRHEKPIPGSIITVTMEGTRPLLVEVQALVDESSLSQPRRVTLGLDQNRLAMLIAVMHRHAALALFNQDVFVNVVGGVRVNETAADLAVMLATLSSYRDRPLSPQRIAFGEIGLAGEIRPVPNGQERLRAAAKHGFKQAIIPQANRPKDPPRDMEIIAVQHVKEVLDYC
ncbi:MAG: DNA repair protein RadA [Gammaproteobacteria bacterium]|nr:DNA repair protein RadA [Gammaproteobacteria bacterium]